MPTWSKSMKFVSKRFTCFQKYHFSWRKLESGYWLLIAKGLVCWLAVIFVCNSNKANVNYLQLPLSQFCLILWAGSGGEMSLGRQEAFEIFKRDYVDSITIEDNKQLLKQRWVSVAFRYSHSHGFKGSQWLLWTMFQASNLNLGQQQSMPVGKIYCPSGDWGHYIRTWIE